ncbi:hypothetical protein HDU84_003161 [Entophlyctis sp. JEL0112]|nr:hypothetical protein HDU84_003161 [Entophlyctis sp. JEL0112]
MSSLAPALPAPVPVPAPAPPAASAALLPQAAATAPKRKRGRPPLQKSSSGIPSPKATVNLQQDSIACAADIGQSLSQLSDMSLLQQLDLLPTPILSQQQPTSKDPADPAVSSKPRRVTHNVIEKRYRNNLNQRIADLRAAVPCLNLPAGAKKSANADASVANKEEDEGSDDDADAGAGGANGARMNKGTILLKATEYIRELEDNLNKTRSQMQQLQSLVVQKFGNDGEALIADFTASREGLTTLNVGTPTSLSRAKSSSPSNKRTKIESKSSGEPNMLGSGIALHHQIQQWLTLQQQYQVAAAVAAAASVEAFKSLSASPPPTVHSNPSISPGIPPVSPDDHLGLLLANGPLGNSDTGMLLDGAEQSSQSMFNYLFDFGTDINDTTGANGARLLAMMFMSASVFYSPSPLVVVGKDSLHSHVLGRMLGTDNVNIESHVHFAGFKLDDLSEFSDFSPAEKLLKLLRALRKIFTPFFHKMYSRLLH